MLQLFVIQQKCMKVKGWELMDIQQENNVCEALF